MSQCSRVDVGRWGLSQLAAYLCVSFGIPVRRCGFAYVTKSDLSPLEVSLQPLPIWPLGCQQTRISGGMNRQGVHDLWDFFVDVGRDTLSKPAVFRVPNFSKSPDGLDFDSNLVLNMEEDPPFGGCWFILLTCLRVGAR